MLDARNNLNITGGLVADPETPSPNIVKFRIGVDYAGNEKNSDNHSGYFDVTYFTSDDNPNTKFVARQVSEGKLKKGSRVSILGRLVQERWEGQDGKKNSRVVIVAESMSYASSLGTTTKDTETPVAASSSVPNEF